MRYRTTQYTVEVRFSMALHMWPSHFTGCHAMRTVTALAISDSALADCRDCTFVACMSDYGGAVYLGGESTFNVGFTTFYGNTAWASGGAVGAVHCVPVWC